MNVAFVLFLALLSRANATGSSFLRGEAAEEVSLGQLACIIKGGNSKTTCISAKSEDGSQCVWFQFATYGACFSEAIASQMEHTIPGLECGDNVSCGDDDGGGITEDDMVAADDNVGDDNVGDDDEADDDAADDDAADDDAADDDTAPQDDEVPDDYWNCLENYATSEACTNAGCAWCDNKGGYGVCMDKDQAATFDDNSWYSCTMPSLSGSASHPLPWNDPSDSSCLVATIGGDGATCKATVDSEGKACDWCSFQGYDFCLNGEQAQLAEEYGASCDDRVNDEATGAKDLINDLADPNDTTCLLATLSGNADTCKDTADAEGKSCDWCSFQGYEFCLNEDQAQIAEQYGASCDDRTEPINNLADPRDWACIKASIQGEDACKGTADSGGNSCNWCLYEGTDVCLNEEQAGIMEKYGATCDKAVDIEVSTETLSDPSDPSCLLITINGDESACRGSTDVDGKACEWCSFQSYEFCVNVDQAEIVEQYGATCNEEAVIDHPKKDLSDPMDTQCLAATVNGDKYCQGATDSDGKPCQWCSLESYEFCLDVDQAQIVEQFGADCGDGDSKANDISTSVA